MALIGNAISAAVSAAKKASDRNKESSSSKSNIRNGGTISHGSWNQSTGSVWDGDGNKIGTAKTRDEYEKLTGGGSSGGGGGSSSSPFDTKSYLNNYEDKINDMYDQQREAQLEQLRAQREQAIGQINQQKQQAGTHYQGARNQADVVNMQNVKKLQEVMAANGLNASGENVTASTNLANQRQNSLNSLNTQEQQTIDDFNRRISDLNNPASENSLIAKLEAERARALLDLGMQADQIGYSRGRDSVMDQRYLDELAYGRGRDDVMDDRYQQQWDYQAGRDQVADERYKQEWEWQKKQAEAEKQWREYTFKNMSAAQKAQLEWDKARYGEDKAWDMYALQYEGELQKSMNQTQIDFYNNSGFNNAGGGGGYSNNYKTQSAGKSPTFQSYQGHLQQAIKLGVPAEWATALTELVGRESSWNPKADNPSSTAYGYGQFLDSTESNYEKKTGLNYDNPVHQLVMMAQYVKDRYGTPEKALAFWDKNKWY